MYEWIGTPASSSASRWDALEPVRQGITQPFGGVGPDVAKAPTLRHHHGTKGMSDDFRDGIECFGMLGSPAFVRHNASWRRQRHGHTTPDQIRAEQKAREPKAATGVEMAA